VPTAAGPDSAVQGRPRRWAGPAATWVVERWLVLMTGLLAAIPIIVAMVHAISVGWAPVGDDALIAVRSYDVLSSHPPLVGMPAGGATGVVHEQAYHLGPMLFWLLALPARFLGPSSLPVTVGIVSVASVMGTVGLAHRRGGRPLMFATAIALPLMLTSLPTVAYGGVWNPGAPLLAFALLVFLAWSLACGEYRLLPLAVAAASFAVQCHLTYLLPALATLAVGVGGLFLLKSPARRRAGARAPGRRAARERKELRRWVVAAIVVGLVCWSAPLLDQAVHRPGNLVVLERAARAAHEKLGSDVGWHAVVHSVGVRPWWLEEPRGALQRIGDLRAPIGAASLVSSLFVLAGLVWVTVAGWRRRRRDVVAAGVLGLALCAAIFLCAASVPVSAFATVGYALWWASPAGMCIWLMLGWSVATLLAPVHRLASLRPPRLAAAAAACAVVLVAVLVAASADWQDQYFREMRAISAALDAKVPRGRPVRVEVSLRVDTFMATGFRAGIVYSLRRDGRTVTAPVAARLFGSQYGYGHGRGAQVLHVDIDRPPPRRARVVSRLVVATAKPDNPFSRPPPTRLVTVSLLPPPAH
jgi:hypothetical protein